MGTFWALSIEITSFTCISVNAKDRGNLAIFHNKFSPQFRGEKSIKIGCKEKDSVYIPKFESVLAPLWKGAVLVVQLRASKSTKFTDVKGMCRKKISYTLSCPKNSSHILSTKFQFLFALSWYLKTVLLKRIPTFYQMMNILLNS